MSAAALACLKHSARNSATDCPCARCADAAEIDHANAETSKATANRVFEIVIIISLLGFRDDAPPECPTGSGDHLVKKRNHPYRKLASAFDGVALLNAMKSRSPCSGFFRIWLR
jgi:hypothetical protein